MEASTHSTHVTRSSFMSIRRLVFIGFRGTGKTTLSQAVAQKIGWHYCSTDALIEEHTQKSITEIVSSRGWAYFRQLEQEILKQVVRWQNVVIDCGGGVIEDERNMELLAPDSFIVWVDAQPDVVIQRLKRMGGRPLLSLSGLKEDVLFHYQRRQPLYAKYAHFKVDTTQTHVVQIVNAIVEELSIHER